MTQEILLVNELLFAPIHFAFVRFGVELDMPAADTYQINLESKRVALGLTLAYGYGRSSHRTCCRYIGRYFRRAYYGLSASHGASGCP